MKLFLVSLAVCIGAVSASGGLSLPRCSKTVEKCLGEYEIVHFNKVIEGVKCISSVTNGYHISHPAFDNAFMKVEPSPKGVNHTKLMFTRRQGIEIVKETEVDVYEPSCPTNLFSEMTGFPSIGYRSDIITIRCVTGCGVYLSCPCDPKDGPIAAPTCFVWSDTENARQEDLDKCEEIGVTMDSRLEFKKLTKA